MWDEHIFDVQFETMSASKSSSRIAVAIPAHNESQYIEACMSALAGQTVHDFLLVVLCNNCIDDTYSRAIASFAREGLQGRIIQAQMASAFAHAGGARRAAMNSASDLLNLPYSVLLTTDADSVPEPDWIANNVAAIQKGVEGVAGALKINPSDRLPQSLQIRGALEAEYEALLNEMFARVDPVDWDPWPRHACEPGASLAVTTQAYKAVGGCPPICVGEDRALFKALEAEGYRVRHDPTVQVVTSGRLVGRAAGGVADTLRTRSEHPDLPCDPYLEPAWNAFRRALWRKRCRDYHRAPGRVKRQAFARAWSQTEKSEPLLARTLIKPSDLEHQIEIARAIVRRLRNPALNRVAERQYDRIGHATAVQAEDMNQTP